MGLGDLVDDNDEDDTEDESDGSGIADLVGEDTAEELEGDEGNTETGRETFSFETSMRLNGVTVNVTYELDETDDRKEAGMAAAENKAMSVLGRLFDWQVDDVQLPNDLEERVEEALNE